VWTKHLGIQDLIQTYLVHEIEVVNSHVPICKTIRRKQKKSLAKQNCANRRKFHIQAQAKEKEKENGG